MGTTAQTIITGSMDLIGVYQQDETPTSAELADGLRRLNNLVAGWRTQFGTVTAIERQVFALTANVQTYSIGPGGDFDVPRPVTVPAAGLWMNALAGAETVTITRSGAVATVTLASHGLAVGDETLIAGAAQGAYNGLQTVTTVPTSGTFTFTVEGTPTTPATGTITSSSVVATPIEIPRAVITDDAYQLNQLKNLSNSLFTTVYYSPTYPLGTIVLWPRPNTADHALVLYLQSAFTGFADLSTEYDFPELPGYNEALEYNLAVRLSAPFSRPVPDEVASLARETLGLIKRANLKLSDLPNDAALLTWHRRDGYNIQSDQGG